MQTDLILISTFIFWGAILYLYVRLWRKGADRSRKGLLRWVEDNGYTLIFSDRRLFLKKGPYQWAGSSQAIYRINILDSVGIERLGWVCCGTRFKGAAFSDHVEGLLDESN